MQNAPLNAGQKYCRMLQGEHSAILLTFIKLPFVIKIFVLSIFEWPFYTGFTVYSNAQQNTLSMEADTINPDHTAHKGKDQSCLCPYCLQFRLADKRADNNTTKPV